MANKIFAGPAGNIPVMAAPLEAATDMGCGYLVERQTDATKYTLSAQAATVLEAETLITVDAETSGATVENAASYKADSTVEPLEAKSGDYVYVRFAAGNNITALGRAVTSAGSAGRFALATAGQKIHGYAQEIVNVTANDTLVLIRVA